MHNRRSLFITDHMNSWVTPPGVASGAEVFYSEEGFLGVGEGQIVFTDGRAADINITIKKACKIPTQLQGVAYVVALLGKKSLTFRVIPYEKAGDDGWDHSPITLSGGVVIAKLIINGPTTDRDSVKIFNYWKLKDENILMDIKPLELPDGVRLTFTCPVMVNSRNAMRVTVDGVPQSERVDYTVNTIISENGELFTTITFMLEAPQYESDIVILAYAGHVKLN